MIRKAKNNFIGIDLFAGAGGMSLGAKMAGIDVKMAVEIEPSAAATYKHNHPETNLLQMDISRIKKVELEKKKMPSILFGGPPCQGFSCSNKRTRKKENPQNWLFEEYLRIANIWKPDWIVYENVKGILETEKGVFIDLINKKMKKIGYTPSIVVLNAMDYGVPQTRERVFIIGSLHGEKINFTALRKRKPVTVWNAISDLPRLQNGANKNWMKYKNAPSSNYARKLRKGLKFSPNNLVTKNAPYIIDRYKYIPAGGNWEDIPKRLMKNYQDVERCHSGIYHRLKKKTPSVVIGNFRKNMLIHPTQNRGLSIREAARIQSFPDSYEFKGSLGNQQQQVGNAVPPLLAKAVFESMFL